MTLSEFRLFRPIDIQEPGLPWSNFVPGEREVVLVEQANGVVLVHREGARDLVFALSSGYGFAMRAEPAKGAKK
jgi:hypothetical protein